MTQELTFRVEEDGQTRDVVVPMRFDDLPALVMATLMTVPESERVAVVLAYRCDVPLEAAQRLVDELLHGEGVQVY